MQEENNGNTFYHGQLVDASELFEYDQEISSFVLSNAGKKLLYDIPPMFCNQGTSDDKPQRTFRCAKVASIKCYCSSGETCGWIAPLARRCFLPKQSQHQESSRIRLRCTEAWQLRDGEVDSWKHLVRSKVGSDTTDLWKLARERFQGYIHVEIYNCCGQNTFWLKHSRDSRRVSQLLYAQQTEAGGFQFILCTAQVAFVEAIIDSPHYIRWTEPEHTAYNRLVEYQFIVHASIQVETALSFRTSKFAQDFFGEEIDELLTGLQHADQRGLLRLL